MMPAMREAARRRLARLSGDDASSDGGFVLIYVLLVTTIIMIGVLSVLVATAANSVPAKQAEDNSGLRGSAGRIEELPRLPEHKLPPQRFTVQ